VNDTPAITAALDEGPGFAEPWQAQAFACALQLSRRGLFTWREWVDAFSAEIAAHPARFDESAEAAYYRQWLRTLEKLVGIKGAASAAEIDERAEQWRRAYLNTPHGQAVELTAASVEPADR
jgi:nitrile hydratase accessory protein